MIRINRKACQFVCFIGIDGAGKTTLAHSVVNVLNQRGFNFIYVHSLIDVKILKPFMVVGRFLFARGSSKESDYARFAATKRSRFSKYPIFFLPYRTLLFLDYFPQVYKKIVLPLRTGKCIVSDRYVYDTILNASLNTGAGIDELVRSINAYFRVLPRPNLVFLLDVPEKVSISRKNDIPSIEYLQERRGIYQKIAEVFGMTVLGGMKPIEDLTETVVKAILKRMEEDI